jgi:acyl dehydratase
MSENHTQLTRTTMYFEDFEAGQTIISLGRTITEADVVTFACLSGDYSSMHTDADFAAHHPFGQRVAHGLLGMSIAVGLLLRMGFIEETSLGFRQIDGWKFSAPILLGDTIHAVVLVSQTRAVRRLEGGLVTLQVEIHNQAGKVVQQGNWIIMVKSSETTKG